MPANTNPIFGLTPNVGKVSITAANTRSDGNGTIGTDIFKVFTAGANGSFVGHIEVRPVSTVAATASAATVLRAFVATVGSGSTTPGSNVFQIAEVTAAAQTADSSTAATYPWVIPVNRVLASGEFLLVTSHAAPTSNTAWHAVAWGTDF